MRRLIEWITWTISAGLLISIPSAHGIVYASPPESYFNYTVRNQLRDFGLGKRFIYRHSKIHQDLAFVSKHSHCLYREGTRVLEVGRQLPNSVIVPYRFTLTIDVVDEPGSKDGKLLCYWEASDGKQTRSFSSFIVDGQCAGHPEHLGMVMAGPWTNFQPDALFMSLNTGGSALMGIGGQAPVKLPAELYQDHTIEEYNHPEFGKTYIAGGKFGELGWHYDLMLPEPEFLVLASGKSKNVDELVWSVDSLTEYEGFRFPKSGTREVRSGQSSWELISIEDFDLMPGEGVEWFPEWPTGTTIVDHTTGATTRIPFEAREMAQYNRVISKYCDPGIGPVGLASFGWAFWINTALIMGLVGYGAYHWKKRKASR
jgi:hypothetical protein